MGASTKTLQNFLVFQRQRCNDQRFEAWNLNLFYFTHHQTLNPLMSNDPYLPHSFIKLSKFWGVGSIKWRATNNLLASKAEEQGVRIQPLWVLKCSLTDLSTLSVYTMHLISLSNGFLFGSCDHLWFPQRILRVRYGGDIVNKSQFLMLQDFSFRRKRHTNKMSWMGCVCKLRIWNWQMNDGFWQVYVFPSFWLLSFGCTLASRILWLNEGVAAPASMIIICFSGPTLPQSFHSVHMLSSNGLLSSFATSFVASTFWKEANAYTHTYVSFCCSTLDPFSFCKKGTRKGMKSYFLPYYSPLLSIHAKIPNPYAYLPLFFLLFFPFSFTQIIQIFPH
jgi:hypothetical protein